MNKDNDRLVEELEKKDQREKVMLDKIKELHMKRGIIIEKCRKTVQQISAIKKDYQNLVPQIKSEIRDCFMGMQAIIKAI